MSVKSQPRIAVIVAVVIGIIMVTMAIAYGASGYYNTCEESERFCNLRPYHLDCRARNQYGKSLIVTVPCPLPEICKQMPWHISCGIQWCVKECP